MPRKPRFIHPVRQVRTCLGYSQPAFAKLVGCSAVAIQRIENGTLQLSRKLANSILEATGADPSTLRAGREAKAMDMMGHEYSKKSLEFYRGVLPCTEKELKFHLYKIIQYLELLLIASNRSNQIKTYAVNGAIQESFQKIAEDFNLEKAIHNFLIEQGRVDKRIYRVSDLRKFPEYARILKFKDNKRYKPGKLIPFTFSRGWMRNFYLVERPVLPPGADMKLRDAHYILDDERPIPEAVKEAVSQALYWEIKEFRADFCDKPTR
jgi:transcriptional regulator with XRE-family HTH domain